MTSRRLIPLIELVALTVAGYLIYRALRGYSLDAVVRSVTAISGGRLAVAALLAAGSYVTLIALDVVALRAIRRRLTLPRVALASFVSMAVSYNVGVSVLGSAALRYRFYAGWGLTAGDVGRIVLFCSVGVALGLVALTGLTFLWEPGVAAALSGIGRRFALGVGVVCLLFVAAYLLLAAGLATRLRRRLSALPALTPWTALAQIGLSSLNLALVAGVLHQAVGAAAPTPYLTVLAIFIAAKLAAILSHVPGGLGVIEAVVLSFLPRPDVAGALLAFRAVYHLVPLALAGLLFAAYEARRRWRPVGEHRGGKASGKAS